MNKFRSKISQLMNEKPYGRTKIAIPADRISVEVIKQFLPQIMTTFQNNVDEIDYLIDYKNGCQDILSKAKVVREEINNKPVENHAFEIVEFLKGYLVGNPIQLTQRNTNTIVDDITALNNYMTDQDKAKKDELMIENIATFGKHLYLVLPQDEEIENIDKQSPFKLLGIDAREGDVIYSSGIDKKKIGCFVITELPINHESGYRYTITIYAPNKKYTIYSMSKVPSFGLVEEKEEIKANNNTLKASKIEEEDFILPYIPMTEYYFLESRLGIMEVVKDSLDLLNKINANEIDDIEQFVNYILVLVNQDIAEKDVKLLKSDKILKLKSSNPQMPADAKFLQQALKHNEINTFYERVYTMMMSIVAIPRANDNVTSGGDTGQARLLGEGWTLADQRAMTYQNMIGACERELLKTALWICRHTPKCKIDTLFPSEVDVKFNISKSDNMLVKSQTMLNLDALGFPKEIIAEKSQLFNDPLEVAKVWEKYEKEKEQEQDTETNVKNQVINNQDNRTKNV